MRILVGISDALAAATGIDPGLCYLAVLAAAAVTALVVVSLLVLLLPASPQRPETPPLGFEEAKGKDPSLVCWAGRWFRASVQKFHFVLTGTTRAGKSLLLSIYLRSVISQIKKGSGMRLVLFDPKNDLHPDLFEGVEVPVHFLLPSDMRSSRWDLARDYASPAAIKQFSEALVPPVPGDSSPFFIEAVQALISGVITSLDITHPGRWDLGDVVRILESRSYTAEVLGRTPETRPTRERYMREKKMWAGIAATAENVMSDMRIVSAYWSRARRVFSLTDFVRSEGIVVLGRDPRYGAVMDPLNQLFFTLLFGQLLAQEDSKTPRTWVVIDELAVAAGEGRPLPGFKDICERGASRGVVVVVAYQSYASLGALYGENVDAILGMLQHRVFLVAGDSSTAEFASKLFGKTHEWVPMISITKTPDGAFGERESRTESLQWHEEDVVPYEKFIHLTPPSPEVGLWGYRLNPGKRNSGLFHLPGAWLEENRPRSSERVPCYLERPETHQHLEQLSFADFERLKLRPPGLPKASAKPPWLAAAEALPSPSPSPSAPRPAPSPSSAADDVTGKLRRRIRSTRRPASDAST